MRFTVKNVGPIKDVTIKLNKFTMLCGVNNSGKTYLMYSMYSLLSHIRCIVLHTFSDTEKESFCNTGKCSIMIKQLVQTYVSIFDAGFSTNYLDILAKDLALSKAKTSKSVVSLSVEESQESILSKLVSSESRSLQGRYTPDIHLRISHYKNSENIICEYLPRQTMDSQDEGPLFPLPKHSFDAVEWLFPIFVQRFLLKPFAITCERNGVAMFGEELRLFNSYVFDAGNTGRERFQKLKEMFEFRDYPLPIRRELDFYMNLKKLEQRVGLLSKDEGLVRALNELAGGSYSSSEGEVRGVRFSPLNDELKNIAISECSSSVRSLVELDYYVRHMSGRNDLLIIDEPELDLHPSAQRKFARLLARIVNAGTRVFVSTHSDYFAREINSLISAYSEKESIRNRNAHILQCDQKELISPKDVSCYVITQESLTSMEIKSGFGYPIVSFDENIRSFNESYNELRNCIAHDDDNEEGQTEG